MALADDQVQFVQRQLHYHFRDASHLEICFKAAHRSDFDDIAEDGNRTLAKTGATIMDLVEKRCFSLGGTKSRDNAKKRSDWTKSKDLRAAACDNLGFTPLIITSVRQGNEIPSKNIRAATVGAIVAAVFEDLCDQKEPMAYALEKITDLIDLLSSSELAEPQSITTGAPTRGTTGAATRPVSSTEQSAESRSFEGAGSPQIDSRLGPNVQQDSPIFDWYEWIDLDGAQDIGQHFPLDGDTVAGETSPCSQGEVSNSRQPYVSLQNSNLRSILPRSNQQLARPAIQLNRAQRTVGYDPGAVIPPIGHVLSLDEEISRSIDEPSATQLRDLFRYLGSTHSVIAFKRALSDLRGRKGGDSLVLKGAQSDADHLQIVKRLRENSAANSLLTICHIVRLFQGDTDDLIRHPGSFVIQTQTSFDGPRRTATGNPLSLSKAAVTDRKMELLYPNLIPGSEEYQTERRYITRLRQSAAKFALFSKTFGFGVLAFLPHADPLGNGYHLNKLMDIPEDRIACCIRISQKFNSKHIARLSAGAGPIIEKMINGEFWSSNPSRFEELEEREVLASTSLTYDHLF